MPEKKLTKDFGHKSPAEVASIMKDEAGGVKRDAEQRIWPQIFLARDNQDKNTMAFWLEVVDHLCKGTEQPPIQTVESYVPSEVSAPNLTLA